MDYLQGGINLRAMGQKDPLTEWQREGFEMFGEMMTGIAEDFVRDVMNAEVRTKPAVTEGAEAKAVPAGPAVQNLQTSSSDDVQSTGFDAARTAAAAAAAAGTGAAPAPQPAATSKPKTVVQDDFSKTPRNAPCPCGSGKKFKMCHGAA